MSSPHHTSSEHSKGQDGKAVSVQKSRKIMNVTVYFLDDSSHVFQLQSKNLGSVLFEKVCKFLNLLEVDYFGLEYEDDKGTKCWLDALKPLCSQISTSFPTMYFCIKFYTPDPVQLEDEFTRYLFSLQVRKDLAAGLLQCNDNTAAVMISYIIQADIGDFLPEKYVDSSYLSGYKFIPYQDAELERKIMDNHKKIIGQTPAEADLNLLETARRCELYGIKMTPAKDQEGVPLNLAVAHLGVLVFQNFTKINTFSWAKIRKLSFKRKKFLIKLHPEGYGYYKDTVEFFFEGRNECKNFWKKCIENHTFFRCTDAKQGMRQKPKIFSRGSSFRYSGRTQKQVSEFVRENCFNRQPFKRSTSLRTPSSPSKSAGTPISPQPLLPVTSLSCGSISDISKDRAPPQKTFSTSEPTTPHVAQDLSHTLNGDCSKPLDAQPKGLVSSSDFESEQGFQSPDYFTQDTDDNISHDSYHVLEKEAQKTNTDCMLTNLDNISDSKVTESEVVSTMFTNGTKEHIGKFNGTADNYSKSEHDIRNDFGQDEDESSKKPRRHRVRVFSNHICIGQTSPTLYARANRHLSYDGSENLCKAYPRTVDFVLVNQLPAIGSFSYKDDSVELKSPNKIKLEMLEQKLKPTCENMSGSGISKFNSKPQHLPLGVDLLNDLVSPKQSCSRVSTCQTADLNQKESALKVIADNLSISNIPKNLSAINTNAESSNQNADVFQQQVPTCSDDVQASTSENLSSSKSDSDLRTYQNFYQTVYVDMRSDDDLIDHSTHYTYNTYKFSQIGRPPDMQMMGRLPPPSSLYAQSDTYETQSKL